MSCRPEFWVASCVQFVSLWWISFSQDQTGWLAMYQDRGASNQFLWSTASWMTVVHFPPCKLESHAGIRLVTSHASCFVRLLDIISKLLGSPRVNLVPLASSLRRARRWDQPGFSCTWCVNSHVYVLWVAWKSFSVGRRPMISQTWIKVSVPLLHGS